MKSELIPGDTVIHVHTLWLYPQYVAHRLAVPLRIPIVVSPRGALDPWVRHRGRLRKRLTQLAWQGRMLTNAAALHFTASLEAQHAADYGPFARVEVIPNGLDLRWFTPAPERRERAREKYFGDFCGPVLLSHSRLSEKKNFGALIHALPVLEDVRLAIVGPDDEGVGVRLMRLARDLGVSDRVTFAGLLVGDDLRDIVSTADVWALPSRAENFGNAILEALAMGVPAVVSSEVDIAPELAAEKAALICAPSPMDIAKCVRQILADGSFGAALGCRGRAYARKHSWECVLPSYLSMYENALSTTVENGGRRAA